MNLTYFDTVLGFASVMLMLSMLVTILVQMTGTVLNLRGTMLHWGLDRLIKRLDPTLGATARELAHRVLTHDALSHTFGRYAVAIRPSELRLVLADLAGADPGPADPPRSPLAAAAKTALDKLDSATSTARIWFDTIMDRTTERFVSATRVVTVVFAFGLAFVLHIDTPYIVKQLSEKPEVRSAVVSAALKDAVPLYATIQKDEALPLAALRAAGTQEALPAELLKTAQDMQTRAQGRGWIEANVADAALRQRVLAAYETQFDALGARRVRDLQTHYDEIRGWVEASQLQLGPRAARYCDPSLKASAPWAYVGCGPTGGIDHLLGVLVTAMLLGLGAPFWFNLLRDMSNLRPILAGKVDKAA